jgi:hypothetical protein
MNAFSRAVDRLHGHADLGLDALYKAGGAGAGVACRVITRQPDELTEFGGSQLVRATTLIDVRISEVAAPREGDSFVVGATTYTIAGTPRRDAERLVWTCGCRGG